jgi:hypothetical protein
LQQAGLEDLDAPLGAEDAPGADDRVGPPPLGLVLPVAIAERARTRTKKKDILVNHMDGWIVLDRFVVAE